MVYLWCILRWISLLIAFFWSVHLIYERLVLGVFESTWFRTWAGVPSGCNYLPRSLTRHTMNVGVEWSARHSPKHPSETVFTRYKSALDIAWGNGKTCLCIKTTFIYLQTGPGSKSQVTEIWPDVRKNIEIQIELQLASKAVFSALNKLLA